MDKMSGYGGGGAGEGADLGSARLERLKEERKNWNKARPFGYSAKPAKKPDGTTDLCRWEAQIPGPKGTEWEEGTYKVQILFPVDYPLKPPDVKFTPPIFHPNVYPSGDVCLTLINPQCWAPGTSLTDVLRGLSLFLAEPNVKSAANGPAATLMVKSVEQYRAKVCCSCHCSQCSRRSSSSGTDD